MPRLSLWFDELTDFISIRGATLQSLLAAVPHNPGGVPLSYLLRALSVHLLGPTVYAFRLPSALFSLLACAGIFLLGRQIQLRYPLLAVAIFAVIPLQLRYALESRPYSQALSVSIWTTIAFLALLRNPSFFRAALYSAAIVIGLYSQPFTVFVAAAHFLWLTAKRIATPALARALLLTSGALLIAVLLFLPWQWQIAHGWHNAGTPRQQYHLGLNLLPLILHEITGAGYFGALLFAALAAVAVFRSRPWPGNAFWLLYLAVPVLLAVAADLQFQYFFATRQLITILAPLSILAALGLETLLARSLSTGRLALAALLVTCLAGDIHWFRKPRENWQAAAALLDQATAAGNCVLFASSISSDLLVFFSSHLRAHACPADPAHWPPTVAAALDPYGPDESRTLRQSILNAGYALVTTSNPQRPVIEIFRRP